MSKRQVIQQLVLHQDNLVPVYLIEDKLRDNFTHLNAFITSTSSNFALLSAQATSLEASQAVMKESFEAKMKEMEKKIVQQISLELEGRIAIAIGKSIETFTDKMDKKEKEMGDFKSEFSLKMDKMKTDLKFEVAQDNMKLMARETKRIEDSLKAIQKKIVPNNGIANLSSAPIGNLSPAPIASSGNGESWQEQHEFMKGLESRVEKLEDFSINVEKRNYNGMTSLKESWKELGTELLEHKKMLNKKLDEVRMELIKLKNLKEFSVAPGKVEEEFQRKLAEKFTDIYQLLSITLTKNEYESAYERVASRISRHDDEFADMRKELAANNQFFTFYANNANQDDLKKEINALSEALSNYQAHAEARTAALDSKSQDNLRQIGRVGAKMDFMGQQLAEKMKTIDRMNEVVSLVQGRIENLEDFNRFGPDKLQTIHNMLDGDYSAAEKELIAPKEKNTAIKGLQVEIAKIKDEMFVLSSHTQLKEDEVAQLKKVCKELEAKVEKVKAENEDAIISRKPWVCLSCDHQEKEKQRVKKELKAKKEPFKGFGSQRNSEKLLKAPPAQPQEERFEVYEKLREKYLSDAVRLPDIVKEKLKDREASFNS